MITFAFRYLHFSKVADKENMDKKSYCENPYTEAYFYGDKYAVINNTDKKQRRENLSGFFRFSTNSSREQ